MAEVIPLSQGRKRGRSRSRSRARFTKRSRFANLRTSRLTCRGPFPERLRVTSIYATDSQISSGVAGAIGNYRFRCNSLYDPDYTSTGHQPLGFDQAGALYDHYTVVGAKISVVFVNFSAVPLAVALHQQDTVVNPAGISEAREQPGSKHGIAPAVGGGKNLTLSMRYDPRKTWGIRSIEDLLDGRTQTCLFNSNPTEDCLWCISYQNQYDSTDIKCEIMVTIVYDVVYSDVKYITMS